MIGLTPDNDCDHAWKIGRIDHFNPLPRGDEVKKFDMKKSTDSWTKVRDLSHTLIQYKATEKKTCNIMRGANHYLPIWASL